MATTAQIIQHPNATVSPVIQGRWYGNYPKRVVSMRVYKRHKLFASQAAATHAKEVQEHREAIADLERALCARRQWVDEFAKSGRPLYR
nr:hypothetical protein [uncultured Rhodoferax sp.]